MRIIFGIGNPGIRYEFTRHNAGFLLLDFFAKRNSISFKEGPGEYLEASAKIGDQDYSLIKPITFVNNCGIAARWICDKYEIEPENFLVVCDDSNLENYVLRVRLAGGDGGHNGLSSIIYHLITDEFPRIRIGIGRRSAHEDLADYVLSEFSKSELDEYQFTFKNASLLLENFVTGGSIKMLEVYSVLIKSQNSNNSTKNI